MIVSGTPTWKLPPGVSPGSWDYANADHIAEEYDGYFASHPLLALDQAVLDHYFRTPGVTLDLGCGTGRALLRLARRGFRCYGVDLSLPMLRVLRDKVRDESLPIHCIQGNVVELDWLSTSSVDYAICLFSTLGMVQGAENRQRLINHVHRALRPGGMFVLHVHNFWFNLFDPGGPRWLLGNLARATITRDIERGDKLYAYRRIPNMFLHVFSKAEIRRALRDGGFQIMDMVPVDMIRGKELRLPWLMGYIRAHGWIVVCQR